MNARFAEPCREHSLDLVDEEAVISHVSQNDGRSRAERALNCDKDIYIGFFFDGTNNNKYRDTSSFSHSNVARLYEVYPGTPAAQTSPALKPRVLPGGCMSPRPIFPDREFRPASVPPEDFPYYRKLYVSGLGTPLPDVGDSGTGLQKTGGLAAALLGQVRLDWALLQLVNQVHAAVFREPLEASIDLPRMLKRGPSTGVVPNLTAMAQLSTHARDVLQGQLQRHWSEFEKRLGVYDRATFHAQLAQFERRLALALTGRGALKPHLRKIRLSVFGFSRGAAAARAWVNLVNERWGSTLAGLPLQIDFLGLFDTVASVGLAQSTPLMNGHAAWAGDAFMPVPACVRRCVHLVAAHEVRGSFPLDSVCQTQQLPSNCKEIAYPGVHSDVGGGYPPGDQGRAAGAGSDGDAFKLSQIPLAQMYREAHMAGVPLASPQAMDSDKRRNFAIAPQLRDDFNAYIAATRSGSIPPTLGTGHARFASMFPSETQPREELHRVIRRHAGYLLRWRKGMLGRPGGAAGLPGLVNATGESRHQDVEDIRGAEAELRQEIAFLHSTDHHKFKHLDDPFFDGGLQLAAGVGGSLAAAGPLGPLVLAASWGIKGTLVDLMRDKQRQWDTWLRDEWARDHPGALPDAACRLFERHVHDSRAWFKPFKRSDGHGHGMVPDDETWFVFGGREKERRARSARLAQDIARHVATGRRGAEAAAREAMTQLQREGQPLLAGGREPYRLWGYVRHRRLYQTGRLVEAEVAADAQAIARDEQERLAAARRERRIADAKARHALRLKEMNDRYREVMARPPPQDHDPGAGPRRLSAEQAQEYEANHRARLRRAEADLADELVRIDQEAPQAVH